MRGLCKVLVSGLGCVGLAACGGNGGDGGGPVVTSPPTSNTPTISTARVYSQLTFNQPTVLKQAPGDSSRWFVAEKNGFIRVFANNESASSTEVFLDISVVVDAAGEGGLLGFAFHPEFPVTPEVFVSYTRSGSPLISYISRFFSTDNGQTINSATEEILLTVVQPQTNHNGGDILFGPSDGLLYAGFGDGGGGGDPNPNGNAQDTSNLYGSIVRVDVSGAGPYQVPAGNPFATNGKCLQGSGGAACPELFAWGLRNPWRISFDDVTGKLWTGDVGQGKWEEIDVVVNGGNYGWNVREGAHCHNPSSGCSTAFTDPVTEYDHDLGRSVTGGHVYRGGSNPDLVGWYVFGDFISGRIFAIEENSAAGVVPLELLDTDLSIVSFAEDTNGELYVLDFGSVGTIHKVENAP